MAEPNEMPTGIAPNGTEPNEMPSADIDPKLADSKGSIVDNDPKISENSDLTGDIIPELAEHKELSVGNVPQEPEKMTSAKPDMLPNDIVLKPTEADKSLPADVSKVVDLKESTVEKLPQKTEHMESAGIVSKSTKHSELSGDLVPKPVDPKESSVDNFLQEAESMTPSKLNELPVDNVSKPIEAAKWLPLSDINLKPADMKDSSVDNIPKCFDSTELQSGIIQKLAELEESLTDSGLREADTPAKANELATVIAPKPAEAVELPPAGIGSKLPDHKDSSVDNIPKIPNSTELPGNVIQKLAESKESSVDNVLQEAESMTATKPNELAVDIAPKQAEAVELPLAGIVSEVAELKGTPVGTIPEKTENMDSGIAPKSAKNNELSDDLVPKMAKPKDLVVDNVLQEAASMTPSKPKELSVNNAPKPEEVDELLPADTDPKLADLKDSSVDNIPMISDHTELPWDIILNFAELKESSLDNVLQEAENNTPAKSNEMAVDISSKPTETVRMPPAGIVSKVAELEGTPVDTIPEKTENMKSAGNAPKPSKNNELSADLVPVMAKPQEINPLPMIPEISELPVDNVPNVEELKTCADVVSKPGYVWWICERVPKKVVRRRWMTIIDPRTGQELQLQIDEEIKDANKLPAADIVPSMPEPVEKPAVLPSKMTAPREQVPAETVPKVAKARKLTVVMPPRRGDDNKLMIEFGLMKDPSVDIVQKKTEHNKITAGTFPKVSAPYEKTAGRTRTRTHTISQLMMDAGTEMGSLNEMLLDTVTTMEELEELSFDLDESTTSSSNEQPVAEAVPELEVAPLIPIPEPETYVVQVADIKNFPIPKYALAYYGPKMDFETEFPFDTVHFIACKLIIPRKMAYSKVRDSVDEPTRPTLPITFTTAVFRITDRNNWTIELLREQGLCLTFKPIYQGEWEREKDESTLPRTRYSERMEIVRLLTEYTPEAGLRMLQKTLNTMVKMFTFEKINILIKSNFGVMDVPVWEKYYSFNHILIDYGRNITPEELGFILKLKTDKLTIFPKVDPGMDYDGELQYEKILLKHAGWLNPDDGLLQIHSKIMQIGNSTDSLFTVAQVRDYINNWFGDDYDTFQKLRVAINKESYTYEKVLWLLTRGMEHKVAPPNWNVGPQNERRIVIRPHDRKQLLIELCIDTFICDIEVMEKK